MLTAFGSFCWCCISGLSVLSTLYFSFLEPGMSPWLTCLEDGLWSLPEAYCKLECNAPPAIPNANLLLPHCLRDHHDVGSTCRYECKPGYYVVDSAESKVRKWVGLPRSLQFSLHPIPCSCSLYKPQTIVLGITLRLSGCPMLLWFVLILFVCVIMTGRMTRCAFWKDVLSHRRPRRASPRCFWNESLPWWSLSFEIKCQELPKCYMCGNIFVRTVGVLWLWL